MIDWDQVATLRDDVGAEDFEEVIELFLIEVDGTVDALSPALPPQDLAEKLHFLKGSALSLGFRALSDLCHAGERSITPQSSEPGVNVVDIQDCYAESRATFLAQLSDKFESA